jgi:hypothetical protein
VHFRLCFARARRVDCTPLSSVSFRPINVPSPSQQHTESGSFEAPSPSSRCRAPSPHLFAPSLSPLLPCRTETDMPQVQRPMSLQHVRKGESSLDIPQTTLILRSATSPAPTQTVSPALQTMADLQPRNEWRGKARVKVRQ